MRERKIEEIQTDSKVPFFSISSDLWWKCRQIYSGCTFIGNSRSIKKIKNIGFTFIEMHKISEVASAGGCKRKDEPQFNTMWHVETLGKKSINHTVKFLSDCNRGVWNLCWIIGPCFCERGFAVVVWDACWIIYCGRRAIRRCPRGRGADVAVLFYFQVKLPPCNVTTQHIFFCLLVYSKHSFASDILIKGATLPRAAGTAARGPEFKDIPSRHRTRHKTWRTKERQQRERDYSGDLSGSRPLFILSHLSRRCQTTVISSKRCWLTESIHSNLHPTNFQMLRFQFGYNGVTLKRERISLAVWRATAGRENIG